MKFKQSSLKRFVYPFILIILAQSSVTLAQSDRPAFCDFLLVVNLKKTYPEAVAKKKKRKSADWFIKRSKKGKPAELEDLFQKRFLAKAQEVIPHVYPSGVKVSLDITKSPVYSKSKSKFITGGEAQAGTTKFYQYLGAGVLEKQLKAPLGFHLMEKGDLKCLGEIVEKFVNKISQYLKISILILDRGFFWASVVSRLLFHQYSFVIGMKRNQSLNKITSKLDQPLLAQRENFKILRPNVRVEHVGENFWRIKSYTYGKPSVTVQLVIWRQKRKNFKKKKKNRPKWEYFLFITSPDIEPTKVLEIYGTRWRIETAFRQIRQVWGKTRVINPCLRIWMFGTACLLYGSWVYRHAPTSQEERFSDVIIDYDEIKCYQAWMRARVPLREIQDQYLTILEACSEILYEWRC